MTLHDFLTRCKVPDEGFAINIFKDHIMQFKFKDIDAADIRFGELEDGKPYRMMATETTVTTGSLQILSVSG